MNKKDIIDYIVESPSNTNKAVLSGMLDSFMEGDNKEEIEIEVTTNGVYEPATDKVFKKVTVNTPVNPKIELSDLTINKNGTYNANSGYGFNSVVANVPNIEHLTESLEWQLVLEKIGLKNKWSYETPKEYGGHPIIHYIVCNLGSTNPFEDIGENHIYKCMLGDYTQIGYYGESRTSNGTIANDIRGKFIRVRFLNGVVNVGSPESPQYEVQAEIEDYTNSEGNNLSLYLLQ